MAKELLFYTILSMKTQHGICDEMMVDGNTVIACTCYNNYCNEANTSTTSTGILFIILIGMFAKNYWWNKTQFWKKNI